MSVHTSVDTQTHLPKYGVFLRKRQRDLLNSILLLLIPITLFFSIFNVMVMTNFDVRFNVNSYLDAAAGLLTLLLTYLINRMGHYRIAVWTLIILSGFIVTVHVLQSSPPHLELTHYLILLMLAKALLSKKELLLTTLLTLTCIFMTALAVDTISLFTAWNVGTLIIVIYFLLWIISDYRKHLEKDRRHLIEASEIRLRALLDQVPALVWVTDQDLKVQSFNGGQQDLTDDFSSYLVDLSEYHGDKFKSQSVDSFDHHWKGKYYQNTVQAQFDNENKFVGYLGTTIDITERKINEDKTIELAKQKERHDTATQFLNSASHDFRTPLSVLSTSVYLLKNCKEEDRCRHLQNLETSIDKLNKMFDDMFYVIKLDMQTVDMYPIPVNEILRDIISRYEDKNRQLGRTFKSNIHCTDKCSVIGETSYFDRALSNILDNAFQYTSGDDLIELDVRNVDENIQITIINHGPTIPEEHLSQIYNHFFRGETYRSLKNNNNGLGLTITQKIIDLHQGTIQVDSLGEKGVKVTITIPNESIKEMRESHNSNVLQVATT